MLLEVPSVVQKSRHLAGTSDTGLETMVTDLPSYSSLITTLIAGCYVTEQCTECLKLINSLDNGRQQDAFLLLVKGKFTFGVYSHLRDCERSECKKFLPFLPSGSVNASTITV